LVPGNTRLCYFTLERNEISGSSQARLEVHEVSVLSHNVVL